MKQLRAYLSLELVTRSLAQCDGWESTSIHLISHGLDQHWEIQSRPYITNIRATHWMSATARVQHHQPACPFLNIINHGSQITENWHHLLTTSKAEAKRTCSVGSNLGTTSDSWERQVDSSGFGVPQDLGKLRGHTRRRARPARRAGKRTDLGWNPKGRGYPNQAR